jgi:four helix bundle protein
MSDSYRDLIAWQKAKTLALDVYVRTRKFPKDEIYGLTSQMRRAAVSIPSNIVEGEGRYSRKEFVQFLFHARGSLLELITQLSIAHELDYLDLQAFRHLDQATEELGRIPNGLIKRFQTQPNAFPET